MSIESLALRRLEDEAAIRDLVARFADTATRCDDAGFARLWSSDATWIIPEPVDARCRGLKEILALFHKLRDGRDFFIQFAQVGSLEVDGDKAAARCLCQEAAKGPGEIYLRNHALYYDQLRRSDDGWVFAGREYAYLWLDTSAFAGRTFPLA